MKHFIYILLCDQKTYYVGSTGNIERRFKEHCSGKPFYTKRFSELKLVYKEALGSRQEAETRERQLKGWSVAKKKVIISGNIGKLIQLSKSTGSGEVLV